jgi:hypothetical protein
MSNHTPGPWSIEVSATHITVRNGEGDVVFHDDKRIDGVVKDAHLIAAAPEMLEALEMLEAVDFGAAGSIERGARMARIAIAHAKGEMG